MLAPGSLGHCKYRLLYKVPFFILILNFLRDNKYKYVGDTLHLNMQDMDGYQRKLTPTALVSWP